MLYNALGGGTNPFANFLKKNQDAIAGFGRGMVGQPGLREAVQGGFGGAYQMRPMDMQRLADQKAEQQQQQALIDAQKQAQKYSDFYKQNGMDDLAMAVQNGVPVKDTFTEYSKRKGKVGNGTEYGLSPVFGTDEQGNAVMGQLGRDGSFQQVDTGGFQIQKEPIKMDAGTHFILLDPITRQQIGMVPKDNFGKAKDTALGAAEGKTQAEAIASANSLESKMDGLNTVVDELRELSKTATYTIPGQIIDEGRKQLGMDPTPEAVDRARYIAIVDNQVLPLLRDTFGAAFTQKEGESLRATLGDPNKSPAEKQAVLEAFIAQKQRDLQAFQIQAGQTPAPINTTPATLNDLKSKYGLD